MSEREGACVNSYGRTDAAFCTTMFPAQNFVDNERGMDKLFSHDTYLCRTVKTKVNVGVFRGTKKDSEETIHYKDVLF